MYISLLLTITYSQNYIYQEDDWYILSHPGTINAIAETPFKIYFASDNGIYEYDRTTKEIVYDHVSSRYLPSKKIYHYYYDSYTDFFWIVHKDGINYKSSLATRWNEIHDTNFNTIHPLDVEDIGSNGDYVYIKTSSYIVPVDPFTGEIKYLEEDEMIDVNMINWGYSRFGQSGENSRDIGFLENQSQENMFSKRRFDNHQVTVSMIDSEGNEWFGTIFGDILKKPYYSNRFTMVSIGPGQKFITEIFEDKNNGEWWFADSEYRRKGAVIDNHNMFLTQWIEDENEWKYYYSDESVSIQNTNVNCFFRSGDFLYIGTMDGLLILDIRKREWQNVHVRRGLLDSSVWDMVQIENSIYIATARGINEFSTIGNVVVSLEEDRFQLFRDLEIYDLEISGGFLYIASEGGLYREDLTKSKWEFLSDKFIRQVKVEEDIVLASDRQLWKINPQDKIQLLHNKVVDFALSGDFVWISSIDEVLLLNLKTGGEWVYTNEDGIPGQKIYTIDCDEDWVWFGTNNGIAFYNWSRYHQNEN
ncbi:MAG: hypothetical protein ISR90_03445 [Candidatus Marinimicrobia bacterium]|nr:hypothetical protein [Candidatus Neomarinimicrobiota bacterium]MBL7023094.1 hypothetical protein [Candidatus Neomarinimicrobiota bacterium]MBL7109114.1 hypothetical protein [Candidatus Neomarinimicrobiota bacterium]